MIEGLLNFIPSVFLAVAGVKGYFHIFALLFKILEGSTVNAGKSGQYEVARNQKCCISSFLLFIFELGHYFSNTIYWIFAALLFI